MADNNSEDFARDDKGRFAFGNKGGGRKRGMRRLTEDLFRILGEVATNAELNAMYDALEIPEGLRAVIDFSENRQEAFARTLVYRMMMGSWAATNQIGDRIDPRPKALELSGPGGTPIRAAGVALTGPVSSDDAAAAYHSLRRGEEPADADPADD